MKLFISSLVFFIYALPAFSQDAALTGKWMAVEKGDTMFFEAGKDNLFFMWNGDQLGIGGANYKWIDGRTGDTTFVDCKYKTNTTHNPAHLYLVLYKAGTDTPFVWMLQLYKHIDGNTMQVSLAKEDGWLRFRGEEDWKKAEDVLLASPFDERPVVFKKVKK